MSNRIFVFGSNLAGIHGGGSAKAALLQYGAVWGQGVGLQGDSYAIPTKDENLQSMPLEEIAKYVFLFKLFAETNPGLEFDMVKIGCGLAGYKESDIAPMFVGSPANVHLPEGWDA